MNAGCGLQSIKPHPYDMLCISFADKGFIDACISSSVRPLVSGTSLATNRTVMPHMLENMKKVPESKIESSSRVNIQV